jgi:hypothetical protein
VTDDTGTITLTVVDAVLLLLLLAVICAEPIATAVTNPLLFTVAIEGLFDVQVRVFIVAFAGNTVATN